MPKKRSADSYQPNVQNYSFTLDDGSRVNPLYKDCVLPNILPNESKCLHDLFKAAMTLGGDRDFLGTHPTPSSPYVWKSFRETYELVKQFGSGLRTIDSLATEDFKCVGIFGKNRPEWLIAEYACFSFRLTVVPFYDTLTDDGLLHICKQTELSVIVCDTADKGLKLLSLAEEVPFVRHIIVMNDGDDLTALNARAGDAFEIYTFAEILDRGKDSLLETMPSEPDDLALLCYTSGTTGLPKGVVISNRMILAGLNKSTLNAGQNVLAENAAYLSYLPLAHIYEQMFTLLTIIRRGRIGFYSGEPRLLFEDAKMLKPALWITVPRILLRIYEGVQKKVGNSGFKKALLDRAIGAKIKKVDLADFSTNTIWDLLFFSKIRAMMGGNVRVIVSGGAPLPHHVLRFVRAAFSCWVFEVYGSTETAGSLSASVASDRDGGHVGAPVPGLKIKLADIPSMGIVAARDNKGEVCVKGPNCTTGYYKDPENTAELFDSEGWMRTGDVGIWTEKNSLKIVDRCKHIFKLSQGEYVVPERVESVYLESQFVTQIFVDGDAEQTYPVAIVVPEPETLVHYINCSKPTSSKLSNAGLKCEKQNGKAGVNSVSLGGHQNHSERDTNPDTTYVVHGRQMTLTQLCDYKPAINAVLADLNALGRARGLKGFEQVQAIRLSAIPFTIDNGMLTPTLKAARGIIRREFASAIKALYPQTTV